MKGRSRFSIPPTAAAVMALATTFHHIIISSSSLSSSLSMAWSMNNLMSSKRLRIVKSNMQQLTSLSTPFKSLSVTSSLSSSEIEPSTTPMNHHDGVLATASYETWGDGNLVPETFAELYSPSLFSLLSSTDSVKQRHHHHHNNNHQRNKTTQPLTRPHLPEWLLTRVENLGYIRPTMMQRLALDVLLPRMEIRSISSGDSSTSSNPNNNVNNEGEEMETVENEKEKYKVNDDDINSEQALVDQEEEEEVEEKEDVILHAQTGSGKTLAYLLPTLCDIDSSRQVLQAVIIVPTRELGLQVVKIARRLAGGGGSSSSSSGLDAQIEEEDDGDNHELEDYDDDDDDDIDDNESENNASRLENDLAATATSTTTTSSTTTPSARRKKIIIMPILQGSTNARVRGWAKSEPPHIMVGTPEELCGLLSRFVRRDNNDFVKSVSTVVVDEVDACLSSWRGGGGGGGGGCSGQQGGALHEVLSKYLSPTSVDHRDGVEDIDDADFNDGRHRRRRRRTRRRESTASQSQQQQLQRCRRRTIFASATIPQHNHFAKSCVRNGWTIHEPTIVTVGAGPGGTEGMVPPTLEHVYVVCKDSNSKMGGLRRWMKKELLGNAKESMIRRNNSKKVLIFCNDSKPRQLEELAQILSEDWNGVLWKEGSSSTNIGNNDGLGESVNYYDAVISILRLSDTPGARAAAMAGFRGPLGNAVGMGRGTPAVDDMYDKVADDDDIPFANSRVRDGKLRILLSTDLAARGLDVPDVTHVVNFDLPGGGGGSGDWYDAYVHRGGRAGRLGRRGKVMTLITPEEEFVMRRLANRLSLDLKCVARQVNN